jgi:hypothetical protein
MMGRANNSSVMGLDILALFVLGFLFTVVAWIRVLLSYVRMYWAYNVWAFEALEGQ